MIAIKFMKGTKYDCNAFQWGLNMSAILITKGTKYNCNYDNDGDLI